LIRQILQFRSDLPISPRHHASAASNNNRSSETISSIIQTPIPSMILRDTSIREQSSLSVKDSQTSPSYFRGSLYNNNNSSFNSYSSRERDCSSPFYGSNGSNNLPSSLAISNSSNTNSNGQLSLGSRENNSIIMRDNAPTRVASNRFLSGLDAQRIVKQSSEDCRRLLQQVG
jgi:hypothetical protein